MGSFAGLSSRSCSRRCLRRTSVQTSSRRGAPAAEAADKRCPRTAPSARPSPNPDTPRSRAPRFVDCGSTDFEYPAGYSPRSRRRRCTLGAPALLPPQRTVPQSHSPRRLPTWSFLRRWRRAHLRMPRETRVSRRAPRQRKRGRFGACANVPRVSSDSFRGASGTNAPEPA